MTDLAKKLNAGRLYYVKKKNGKIVIRQAHLYSCLITEKATPYVDFDDNDIEEVLAPVPSYEELKKLKSECKSLSYGLDVAVKRNRYLLRLLKECKDRFVAVTTNIPINLEDCDLINRVHQEVYDLETEL